MRGAGVAGCPRGLGWAGLAGLMLVLACAELSAAQPGAPEDALQARASGQGLGPWHEAPRVPFEFGELRPRLHPWATDAVSVATDGEVYLAVWRDSRAGGIFGARVTREGEVLEPAGLLLNPGGVDLFDRGGRVAVAFDGTHFLVVWLGDPKVFAVRVRPDGTLVDAEPRVLTQADSGGEPALACDGAGRCLVVLLCIGDDDSNSIDGVLVEDGASLPASGRVVARGDIGQPRVAWTGRRFLVVWPELREGSSDVLGARVEREGTVLDSPPLVISAAEGDQRAPDVAGAGEVAWVVWEDTRRGEGDIFGARLREATVLDAEGLALSTAGGRQHEPRVADAGRKALAVWTDERPEEGSRLRGTRLRDDGTVVNRAGFPITRGELGREENPAVACGREHCLVPFQSPLQLLPRGFPPDRFVLATRVTLREGALDSPPLELSTSAPAQFFPALAWGEDVSLAVWQEFGDVAGPRLRASRVDRDGRVLDVPGLVLPSAPGASRPAVGFDGRRFLVVWQEPGAEGSDIRGARVSASGGLLDTESLAIATAPLSQEAPSVAGADGLFLVAWEESFSVLGARVTGDGTVLDAEALRLTREPGFGRAPDVVALGERFLVVWEGGGIQGTRVARDGGVLDTPALRLSPPTLLFEASPAVSFDGATALVVWNRFGDIIGTRVSPEGTLVGTPGFAIAEADGEQGLPNVAFDGESHRVVWLDTRPPVGPLNALSVHGTRVTPGGEVLEPGGVPLLPAVFSDFPYRAAPALAADGRGGALLLHTRFIDAPEVYSFRLVGRALGED